MHPVLRKNNRRISQADQHASPSSEAPEAASTLSRLQGGSSSSNKGGSQRSGSPSRRRTVNHDGNRNTTRDTNSSAARAPASQARSAVGFIGAGDLIEAGRAVAVNYLQAAATNVSNTWASIVRSTRDARNHGAPKEPYQTPGGSSCKNAQQHTRQRQCAGAVQGDKNNRSCSVSCRSKQGSENDHHSSTNRSTQQQLSPSNVDRDHVNDSPSSSSSRKHQQNHRNRRCNQEDHHAQQTMVPTRAAAGDVDGADGNYYARIRRYVVEGEPDEQQQGCYFNNGDGTRGIVAGPEKDNGGDRFSTSPRSHEASPGGEATRLASRRSSTTYYSSGAVGDSGACSPPPSYAALVGSFEKSFGEAGRSFSGATEPTRTGRGMLKRDDDNGGNVFVVSKQYVDAATDVMGAAGPAYLPSSTYVSQHHVFANNDSSASMFQEVPSERVLRLARTGALGSSNNMANSIWNRAIGSYGGGFDASAALSSAADQITSLADRRRHADHRRHHRRHSGNRASARSKRTAHTHSDDEAGGLGSSSSDRYSRERLLDGGPLASGSRRGRRRSDGDVIDGVVDRQPVSSPPSSSITGNNSSARRGTGTDGAVDRVASPRSPGHTSSPATPDSERRLRSSDGTSSGLDIWEPLQGPVKLTPGLIGLRNTCNNCYINSPIQCLSATRHFAKFFITGNYVKDLNPVMKHKRGTMAHAVSNEIANVLRGMWESNRTEVLHCTELKRILGVLNPVYREDSQEDAYEFLQFLLEILHEELDRNPEMPEVRGTQSIDAGSDPNNLLQQQQCGSADVGCTQANVLSRSDPAVDALQSSATAAVVSPVSGSDIGQASAQQQPSDLLTHHGPINEMSAEENAKNRKKSALKKPKSATTSPSSSSTSTATSSRSRVRLQIIPGNEPQAKSQLEDLLAVAQDTSKEKGAASEDATNNEPASAVPLTADEYWKQYYSKNNSHITDLFYGLVVMQDTCVECKKSFKKFEPISSLYLPIKYQEDAVSLEECVSAYFAREEIPNFHCQACNTRSMAIRYTFLHRGPEILVLRINRDFNRHGSGKVDTPIDMETDILDLGRFAHAEAGTSSPFRMTYRLYATCNHYGSVQTGHYTAHSRHKPIINDKGEQALSRWYRFDDDKVYEQASKVPPKSAIEPYEVYIMFFQLLPDGLSDGQRRLSKELWNMPRSPVSDSPH